MGQVQTALPKQDLSNTGWTPQPVWSQLRSGAGVFSKAPPQGETFKVLLDPLAWPGPGPETLTVNLQELGSGNVAVTVTLLQGSQTVAGLALPPGTPLGTVNITLTDAEKALITDYTQLSVQVTAIAPGAPCCPNGLPTTLHASITPGQGGTCSCLPPSFTLTYDATGNVWGASGQAIGCPGPNLNWNFRLGCSAGGKDCTSFHLDGGPCGPGQLVSGCSCNPLDLIFTFSSGCELLCSGSFQVHITT